jgi:hypothetical protein
MDRQMLIHTLGVVARARGMMKLAKETGITRAGLYKALSPKGNPSFETDLPRRIIKTALFATNVRRGDPTQRFFGVYAVPVKAVPGLSNRPRRAAAARSGQSR